MHGDDFRNWSRRAADWGADYRQGLRDRPVRPRTQPGDIAALIETSPPEQAEPMERIFADFEQKIVPGMTHWQHPRFFAYFPANSAPVSVVAEYLVTTMAAQCMLWQTSPAATELETVMIDWLRLALGLRQGFSGVIQDSASSATLAAVLTMRERALSWQGNAKGLAGQRPVRIYSSDQVHTSVDRAIWVSGVGADNHVRIPTAGRWRGIDVDALERAILADRAAGLLPAGIVACVGGTSVGGTDDISAVTALAKREGLYVHVDAAWAGAAMICPEFRHFWAGVDEADSIVFNPHKWLGAQFDCSVQFVRDPESLVKTLAIQPEYLKTHGKDGIVNYSEWSVPLGRRFRALKLWFLLRAHGLEGLRTMIRNHVAWSAALAGRLAEKPGFEIVTEPMLSLFSFRHAPNPGEDADAHNLRLVNEINDDGRIYLTQTRVDGKVAVRFQAGQFEATEADVDAAFDVIVEVAARLGKG
ncbi:aspartate aminotransferase family protein [Mesorhizobium sp. L-8-10]|uniref:pyridoxal phosphate-dependent decarboxylase family protein n=1 Tax=Mesorhizobium sp. L-8-10 TaxID=2744523 RepID=UPI001926E2B8|nr:pyridoxal-dependent decarboxylase [Mesorhizobium sp. L-8-10]BCH32874.1 aspartate aminotransferase family protein [Mesorhizobium sp. L-8-10]